MVTMIEQSDTYKINLPRFEGPLDLLLFLIKKNDLDIYDIPISFITDEYLKYLDKIQELDIDLAGEFLMMAAELTRIKSQTLLPREPMMEEEEGVDPRAELARRLLEYQKFKLAAQTLLGRRYLGRDWFCRPPAKTEENEDNLPWSSDVYKLIGAFETVLKRMPKDAFHPVMTDRLSVSQRMYQLLDLLQEKELMALEDLLPNPLVRYDVVITFLALLEMMRLRMVHLHQENLFDRLWVRKTMTTITPEEHASVINTIEG